MRLYMAFYGIILCCIVAYFIILFAISQYCLITIHITLYAECLILPYMISQNYSCLVPGVKLMWKKFIVILPIKKKWLDMILLGEEEGKYREIKPYCMSRFRKLFWMYPILIPQRMGISVGLCFGMDIVHTHSRA